VQKSEVPLAALPPRSEGRYYLPITYENQCKACHPLAASETSPDGKLQAVSVPHRLQPEMLDRWLGDYFTAQAARGLVGFMENKISRPLPGKKPVQQLEPTLQKLVETNLEAARRELYQLPLKKNCGLCHQVDQPLSKKGVWQVAPTAVPQVWLQHARFDHQAHRAVDCRECHQAAYASTQHGDVVIAGVQNCVQCHSATGGARFNCTECHNYHHGEAPLAGRGAAARGVDRLRTIRELLE
jgi:hypothetical protein